MVLLNLGIEGRFTAGNRYFTPQELDGFVLRNSYLQEQAVIARAEAAGTEPDLARLTKIRERGVEAAERLDQGVSQNYWNR